MLTKRKKKVAKKKEKKNLLLSTFFRKRQADVLHGESVTKNAELIVEGYS